jgi:hypothetical protein
MKYSTLIALFLLVNFYSPIAKGQQSYDKVPVTLTNYTFNSNKVKSGNLTGLVFPKEKNITLSGKDAKWLFIKDHSVFIKSKFAKAAL